MGLLLETETATLETGSVLESVPFALELAKLDGLLV